MRRPRIALLTNSLDGAYQVSLRNAIERAALSHDVNIVVCVGRELEHPHPADRALNVVYEWLCSSSVDGVILLSAALANFAGTAGIVHLVDRLTPTPAVSVGLDVPGVASIVIDNRAAMRVAAEHLLKKHGCQRIAYIGGPAHNQEASSRLQGYESALSDAGIAIDPNLVALGHFTLPTGRAAMAEILSRTRDFEAVITANDYMALGAIDELHAHHIDVPEDVLVVGFDDAPVARFAARSLTTIAQPIEEMAHRAVTLILDSLAGKSASRYWSLGVHLMPRESCGCGYVLRGSSVPAPTAAGGVTAAQYLAINHDRLVTRMLEASGAARQLWENFVPRLITTLVAELEGSSGSFLRYLEEVAEDLVTREGSLDDVGRAIVQLRRECRAAGFHGANHVDIEETAMKALAILSATATRREGRKALDLIDQAHGLRHVSQQLSVALDPASLAENFAISLREVGLDLALLAVRSATDNNTMVPLLLLDGQSVASPKPYAAGDLFPKGFPDQTRHDWSLIVLPLTSGSEVLGMAAFHGKANAFVCESLRDQVSTALKLSALHTRVVEETALRERLAHQQLLGEMAIAKRVQTALLPAEVEVPTLSIAAGMHVADQVGGDYYDLFAVSDGCWIGIGDVTGHGLLAGLIMVMMQSVMSALVQTIPDASTAELVARCNDVLRPNIRQRLGTDEHVTFTALRYFGDGRLRFSGAHEDLILLRAGSTSAELIETHGMWLGILEDVRPLTVESELLLSVGDLLVLYTDGLLEARNAEGEQFGIERVCRLVEENADRPVAELYDQLMNSVRSWAPVQQDDITLCVLRRVSSTPRPN